jgi:hypothetical protein
MPITLAKIRISWNGFLQICNLQDQNMPAQLPEEKRPGFVRQIRRKQCGI